MATAKNNHAQRVEDFYNEKVPVYIPRPEGEAEDSVTITLNGTNYQIWYDVEVMVPRKVALIIDESKKNKKNADDYMRKRAGHQLLGEM